MNFYVYAYFEPEATEPFYIGKGKDRRAYEHLESNVLARYQDPFHKKLRSMIQKGISPEIHFLGEGLAESEAISLERALIGKFGRRSEGGCLLNMTAGGDGVVGHKHEQESIIKIKTARARQDMSWHKQPVVAKMCGIEMFRFNSLQEAEDAGFLHGNVISAIKGRRNQAYGFDWEYG